MSSSSIGVGCVEMLASTGWGSGGGDGFFGSKWGLWWGWWWFCSFCSDCRSGFKFDICGCHTWMSQTELSLLAETFRVHFYLSLIVQLLHFPPLLFFLPLQFPCLLLPPPLSRVLFIPLYIVACKCLSPPCVPSASTLLAPALEFPKISEPWHRYYSFLLPHTFLIPCLNCSAFLLFLSAVMWKKDTIPRILAKMLLMSFWLSKDFALLDSVCWQNMVHYWSNQCAALTLSGSYQWKLAKFGC